MKKIFLVALAAIGMTACMQDEVVEIANGGAIAFDNAFVGNATRAEVTTANLDAFKVWGYVGNPTGVVFAGTQVNGENGIWKYDGTQYWMPNNDYWFAAIAPASAVAADWDLNKSRTIEFTTDGTVDLVYAAKEVPAAPNYGNVAFQFDHLLSKVKLSFTNGLPTGNEVSIENLKITTVQTASIDLEDKVWTPRNAELVLTPALTNLATEEYFIVPATCKVDFNVVITVGTEEVYNQAKTATLAADAFVMGHAYNLCAEINPNTLALDEIEFSAEVTDWVEAGNSSDAATNLLYAAQVGGKCTLTEDVVLDAPLAIPAGVELVLDLGGHTITTALEQDGRHHYAIENTGTMIIEGTGTINARGLKNFGIMEINGDITITNVDTNGGAAIWNEGKVTINAGTYTTNEAAGEGSYGAALNTRPGGEAVVNGGTFRAYSQLTYAIVNEGWTVINDADAMGKHGAIAGSDTAYTEINGGSFGLFENPGVSDHCAYMCSDIKGGSFTLGNNTDSGAQVFYESTIAEGYVVTEDNGVYTVSCATVSTTAELQAAINAGQPLIYLASWTTFEGTVVMKSNITIEGLDGSKMHCVNLNGADNVTLKNITFDAVGATYGYDGVKTKKDFAFSNIITGNDVNTPNKGAHNLVIDGCKFTGAFKNPGAPIAFTDQKRGEGGSGNITIKNCVFENTNANYTIYGHYTGDSMNGHGNFVIENNTFNSVCYAGPIYLGRYASNVPVKVTGNAFETVTSIDNAIYVQDHSSYGVSVDASGNTFAN